MNADVVRIDEIGDGPTVEVVLGEALLDEVTICFSETSGFLRFEYLCSDGFVIPAVVALIERVAAPEFGANGIPQKLQHLYAIHSIVAVGAAKIFVKVSADVGIPKVADVGVQVDEGAAEILLDDFLDARVSDGHEPTIRKRAVCVRQNGIADPWVWIVGHRIRQRPHHVAPSEDLPQAGLHAPEALRPCDIQRFQKQSGEKIKLDRKPRAAVEHGAREEA